MSAEAIGWFCEHVGQMRSRAQRYGPAADVEALAAAIEAGRDVTDAEVRDLSRRLGGPEPNLRYAPLIPGVGDGEPARVMYRCPHDRCARTGRRAPGGPVPVCGLSGEQMTAKAAPG